MTRKTLCIFLFQTTLFSFTIVHAVDLNHVVSDYLLSHPAVQAAASQVEAAEVGAHMDYLLFFPYSGSAQVLSDFSGEGVDFDGNFTIGYSLFDPNQFMAHRRGEILIKASRQALEWTRKEVLYQLGETWLDVEARKEQVELMASYLEALSRSAEGSLKRYELGHMSLTDLNYVLSRHAAAEAELIEAEMDYRTALIQWEGMIGEATDFHISLELPDPPISQNDDEQIFLKNRNDILQIQYMVEAVDEQIRGTRPFLPGLDFNLGGYNLISDSPTLRLGLTVRIPMGSAVYKKSESRVFTIEKERLSHNLNDLSNQIRLERKRIIFSLGRLREAELSYSEALEYSQKARDGIQVEYDSGYKSLLDFLSAQGNFYQTARNLVDIRHIYKKTLLDYYRNSGEVSLELFK